MRDSRREELDEALRDPFRSPKHFGLLRYWLDESPHSLLAALLVLVMVAVGGPLMLLLEFLAPWPDEQLVRNAVKVHVEAVASQDYRGPTEAIKSPPDPPNSRLEREGTPGLIGKVHGPLVDLPKAPKFPDGPKASTHAGLGNAPDDTIERLEWISGSGANPPLTAESDSSVGTLDGLFDIASSVKSVACVIDKSGSMGPDNKLVRVQAELIRAIEGLTKQQRFSVISFDSSCQTFRGGRLLSATPQTKADAIAWVQGMHADGNTDQAPAVVSALNTQPERIKLLSDGEISYAAASEIAARTRAGTQIDCIGLDRKVTTLRDIADGSGGSYTTVSR